MVCCAEAFWEQKGCCVVILGAAVDLIPCRRQIQWSVTASAINQARLSLWIAPPGLQLHSACWDWSLGKFTSQNSVCRGRLQQVRSRRHRRRRVKRPLLVRPFLQARRPFRKLLRVPRQSHLSKRRRRYETPTSSS